MPILPSDNSQTDMRSLQFTTNVKVGLSQNDSMLRNTVINTKRNGEAAQAEIIVDPFELDDVADADFTTDTPISDPTIHQRWMWPSSFDKGYRVSDLELARAIANPSDAYVMGIVQAYKRKVDSVIIAALAGNATEGKFNGFTDVPLPAAQTIGDGTAALTVSTLVDAKVKLGQGNVDMSQPLFFVCSSAQMGQLLKDPSQVAISSDFVNEKGIVIGQIYKLAGFNIVTTELLPLAGTVRQCFAFSKPCVQFGVWNELNVRTDVIPTARYSHQIYAYATIGAVRVHDAGVVSVEALEG